MAKDQRFTTLVMQAPTRRLQAAKSFKAACVLLKQG